MPLCIFDDSSDHSVGALVHGKGGDTCRQGGESDTCAAEFVGDAKGIQGSVANDLCRGKRPRPLRNLSVVWPIPHRRSMDHVLVGKVTGGGVSCLAEFDRTLLLALIVDGLPALR